MHMGIKVDDGNFPHEILVAASQFFEQGTRGAEEADEKDARRGVVGGVSRLLSLLFRINAIEVTEPKTLQPWNQASHQLV